MNLKERIAEILKEAFGAPVITPAPAPSTALATPPPAAPAAAAPVPYTLQDGTAILVIQAGQVPAVGDMVTNADGTIPAAGVLTLEDGSTLTVDATGLVTEVGAAAPVTTDLAGALPVPTLEERVAQIEAAIARAIQPARMSEVSKEDFEALKAENAKFKKVIEDLSDVVAEIGETPTATPKAMNEAQKERFKRVEELEGKREKWSGIINTIKEKKKTA